MTNIKFPRKEFEKEIKLTPEVIEKVSLFGTPLESISKEEIEIEVFPNRPDLISMQGFLRGFKAFLGKESGLKKYSIKSSGFEIIVDKSVENIRPYCMAAIVKGVNFDDEKIKDIMQWQEKIHATVGRNRKKAALGYYALDKVKFPVKYMADNPKNIVFEPLDMPKKMDALQILLKHSCGKEYGNQLSGFDKFPVYYDSNKEVLSLPPIINSNNSGKIVAGTTDVLIECSGSDLGILKKVISIAVVDLIDMGGKAYSVDIVYGNKKECIDLKPETMKISIDNINKLLGLDLKELEVGGLLGKMGYDYDKGKVKIPAWRTDILHEVDIAEDVAIAYGYDKLTPQIPNISTMGEESFEGKAKTKISEILIGLGLIEISSYHLIKKEESVLSKLENPLELENSKTDYKFLRPNLLIPALRILTENKDNEYPQKIFEMGTVFTRDNAKKTETGVDEHENLLIALSPSNFTEIKQHLVYLFKMLNLNNTFEECSKKSLIEGRTSRILFDGKEIGYFGDVHPKTLIDWSIKMPVSILEISLEEVFNKLKIK